LVAALHVRRRAAARRRRAHDERDRARPGDRRQSSVPHVAFLLWYHHQPAAPAAAMATVPAMVSAARSPASLPLPPLSPEAASVPPGGVGDAAGRIACDSPVALGVAGPGASAPAASGLAAPGATARVPAPGVNAASSATRASEGDSEARSAGPRPERATSYATSTPKTTTAAAAAVPAKAPNAPPMRGRTR